MPNKTEPMFCGITLFNGVDSPLTQAYNRLQAMIILHDDGLDYQGYYNQLSEEDQKRVSRFMFCSAEKGLECTKKMLKRGDML